MVQSGSVERIYIGKEKGGTLSFVPKARAVAGRGLEGDRYFAGQGEFSEPGKNGQDLTLIEVEAIEGLAVDTGIALEPGAARRNVATRGVALNDLVGRRFTVGDVECLGRRLCDPCSHLERATRQGVLKGLANRGGLRADVVRGGWIEEGAPIRELRYR